MNIQVHPIGQVRRTGGVLFLEIYEPFRPALKELGQFSHVVVQWWAHQLDTQEYRSLLQVNPPYAEDMLMGVFATRSPHRPNPIAITTCKILEVDEEQGIVQVANIDAFDGTSILDLKAYFPVTGRVKDATIPARFQGWPEWMPDEGIGLMEHEQTSEND